MQSGVRNRFILMVIAVLLIFVLLGFWLGRVTLGAQVLEVEDDTLSTQLDTEQTLVLRGTRGKILDANGQPLAYNQPSYDVQFLRDSLTKRASENRPLYTEIMIKTIELIEKNGGKTIDSFPIYQNEQGEYYFYFDTEVPDIAEKREIRWRKDMGVAATSADEEEMTPEEIYLYMRSWLYIPESLSFTEARKILSIWNDVQLNSGKSYMAVTVAQNVSEETVAEIESRSEELDGMRTVRSTMRVYPQGEYVSHIIGYTGKVSSQNGAQAYRDVFGYALEDRVGVAGIEKTKENYLTGSSTEHHGKRVLEVTRKGEIIREIEAVAPTDGSDIVLTIDMDMQKVAFDALKTNIEKTRQEEEALIVEKADKYQALLPEGKELKDIQKAETGSVVVMNVNSGKILAMASYPSYDNNDFIVGMVNEEYETKYGEKNPNVPMLNRAIASKTMPGSIFKMATGWAGLQEGVITVDTKISDGGYYIVSDRLNPDGTPDRTGAPRCWIGLESIHNHQDQDIIKALKNSCNYYFFTVADEMKISRMVHWISQLGIDSPTGIELPGEVTGRIGGQSVLFDNTKPINEAGIAGLVKKRIMTLLEEYCEVANIKVTITDDSNPISDCAERLMYLVDDTREDSSYGPAIREIMQEELGISQVLSNSRRWANDVASYLVQLKWNRSQTVRTGIGQAVVEMTPIAAARYVAALVNGGTVYNASVIDRVIDKDGKTIEKVEPSVFQQLDTDPSYLEHIKEGMHEVFSAEDGSASKRFEDFGYIKNMGGKTGTAQVRAANNIDIENTSWLVTFVPYDKPEIVIISCIPHGYAGSYSDTVVKNIVNYYFERQELTVSKTVTEHNGLLN